MAEVPLRERRFDAFLSHSHADKAVVDQVHAWLVRAGLEIWYDSTHLPPGAMIATELGNAIAQCRAALIVLSPRAVQSGWVEEEWNRATVERNRPTTRGFRIIPLLIEDCEVPPLLESTKWVDLRERAGDLAAWSQILEASSDEHMGIDAQSALDVYVSCSWRDGREQQLVEKVLPRLRAPNVRLIGDSQTWPDFDNKRAETIMRSCAGVACVVPNRPRTPDKDELKHFISEARTAIRLGLPRFVVAEVGADCPPDIAVDIRLDSSGATPSGETDAPLREGAQELLERCRRHPRAGAVFLAVEFDEALRPRNELMCRMIERVTGLPCVLGERVEGDAVQSAIIGMIRQSVWVVADVTGSPLNTCIEVGAALGAGVECTLLAKKPYQRPPFMLRGPELKLYDDDVDLLAIMHREARRHRRRVIAQGP